MVLCCMTAVPEKRTQERLRAKYRRVASKNSSNFEDAHTMRQPPRAVAPTECRQLEPGKEALCAAEIRANVMT